MMRWAESLAARFLVWRSRRTGRRLTRVGATGVWVWGVDAPSNAGAKLP